MFVTASIGIALSGGDADTPETLLRNADAAMYRAKEQGRDRAELFDAPTHHRAVDDLRTGNELHRALERGELRVHYQPIIDLDDGSLSGLRGADPLGAPRARARAADGVRRRSPRRPGSSCRSASWALEEACRQAVRWHERRPTARRLSMSVNLSPRQLAEPALPNDVARVLHDDGLDPERALARDHREHADARRRVGAERARRAARARRAPRGRRLRHRLLVAGVPRAAPGRGAEGRPHVRRGRRRARRQHRDRRPRS